MIKLVRRKLKLSRGRSPLTRELSQEGGEIKASTVKINKKCSMMALLFTLETW